LALATALGAQPKLKKRQVAIWVAHWRVREVVLLQGWISHNGKSHSTNGLSQLQLQGKWGSPLRWCTKKFACKLDTELVSHQLRVGLAIVRGSRAQVCNGVGLSSL